MKLYHHLISSFGLVLSLLIVLFVMTGCSSVLTCIWGFRSFDSNYSNEQITKTAFSWGIQKDELYFLQNEYIEYIDSVASKNGFSLNSCDTAAYFQKFKNHSQPLQIMFFDKEGKLVAFLTNCYCGGFPNFKWNRNHSLDTLPARQVTPLDTLISFNKLITLIHNIDNQAPDPCKFINKEYSIVVFWATYFGRQSKRLIKEVEKKYGGFKYDNKAEILYINSDLLIAP
jgi:hypothetical protein